MAVNMNIMVLWVVTACISETPRRFGGRYRLQLQGRRVSYARYGQKRTASLAYFQTLNVEAIYSPKRRTLLNYQALQHTRPHFEIYVEVYGDKLAYETPGSRNDHVTQLTEKLPIDLGARYQHQKTKYFTRLLTRYSYYGEGWVTKE
jgi:hypothetical protein